MAKRDSKGRFVKGHIPWNKKPKITKTCKQCGKEFKVKPSRKNTAKFCSKECKYKWRKNKNFEEIYGKKKTKKIKDKLKVASQEPKITVQCEQCGKKIKLPPWKAKGRRLCSKECFKEWIKENAPGRPENKVTVSCNYCGKTIEIQLWRLKRSEHHFCSKECQHKWQKEKGPKGKKHPRWEGGYEPYYGPNWVEQRRKARERDNYQCQVCGKTKEENGRKLPVHHIKSFREFDNYKKANRLSNLITLCDFCHPLVENNLISLD